MNRKKSNIVLKFSSILIMTILLSTFAVTATDSNNIDIINDSIVTADDSSNITALILGGPGYFIRVSNPKNVTIVANITVNITSNFMGSAEYNHELSVSPAHSNIVYKIGGMPSCIFGRVSAKVSVDNSTIAERNGFIILGLLIIFIT